METLVFSIVGAAISLAVLIIDKKENKKKRIIFTLAAIGFFIFLGQQLLQFSSKQRTNELMKIMAGQTDSINTRTKRMDSVLLASLSNTSIEKIGIAVKSLDELEDYHAFEKGDPYTWTKYNEWLQEPLSGKKALKFTINDDGNYNFSLILLYLMTDERNADFVKSQIESYSSWPEFPRPGDWEKVISSNPLCDLVIFENIDGAILGFAEARELLLNLRTLAHPDEFEDALNLWNTDFTVYASNYLTSFKTSVHGNSLEEVGMAMIHNNIGLTVSNFSSGNYYLTLSNLFEISVN